MTGIIALYIFMLAAFTGYEVIAKVPVILHTPLMSGSNFVHGIVLVGAMIALGHAETGLEKTIGFIGVFMFCAATMRAMVTFWLSEFFVIHFYSPFLGLAGLGGLPVSACSGFPCGSRRLRFDCRIVPA